MSRFLFVGLGNPGQQYSRSRHNAGWLAVDELIRLWSDPAIDVSWRSEKKIESEVLRIQRAGHELFFIKPQTFMNESGRAVAGALHWFLNLDTSEEGGSYRQLIVLHDDLDLTAGQYKLQFASGPKIHNGLNSVRNHLHSDEFWVARLGADGRGGNRSIPGQAYVLQSFLPSELDTLRQVVKTLAEELEYVVLE